uniref:Uncharacterized protein n=1 Tax=Chromera velia CCMP2878 TaxID=1169474 RepID=A0A0G4I7G4_9ALVE|eukprot:Cvel_11625.t1-p1 / transcript=Cvel_11625.t1 / gene=Cvel_11625 / organism=Chromera_velia_CCMP2878 / gene_product=hypothetical protein / transcript_product=hypothetical protein / location=Cvel_scaffold736:45967-48250(-) / protein_length=368 / sequence_SO=supercontig / SO=protein_coding / is_pseudo=false
MDRDVPSSSSLTVTAGSLFLEQRVEAVFSPPPTFSVGTPSAHNLPNSLQRDPLRCALGVLGKESDGAACLLCGGTPTVLQTHHEEMPTHTEGQTATNHQQAAERGSNTVGDFKHGIISPAAQEETLMRRRKLLAEELQSLYRDLPVLSLDEEEVETAKQAAREEEEEGGDWEPVGRFARGTLRVSGSTIPSAGDRMAVGGGGCSEGGRVSGKEILGNDRGKEDGKKKDGELAGGEKEDLGVEDSPVAVGGGEGQEENECVSVFSASSSVSVCSSDVSGSLFALHEKTIEAAAVDPTFNSDLLNGFLRQCNEGELFLMEPDDRSLPGESFCNASECSFVHPGFEEGENWEEVVEDRELREVALSLMAEK